jgi:N-acetylmuramoyl-L-alanine amidase
MLYIRFVRNHTSKLGTVLGKAWVVLAVFALVFNVQMSSRALSAEKNKVTSIELVEKAGTTRFLAELDGNTGFTASVLPDPYRVIIDLPNIAFDLAPGIGHQQVGLISQIRYGIVEKGKSRIVIDTKGPVLITQSQVLPRKGKSKAKLVLDLVATTPEAFAETQEQDQAQSSGETTASLPARAPEATTAKITKAGNRKVIVIDAGHGGIDPGALSPTKTKEKDVVLAFAKALEKSLNATGQYDVRLTRTEDHFMSLADRVAFTRSVQADLFIAIHADTLRGKTARGTTLYTLSDTASDEEAAALALKENRSDMIAGIDLGGQIVEVADILLELVQRESKNHAVLFSQRAVEELKPITLMTGKPLRSGGFVVLKAPDVPSVLVELGFLSSREDEKNLKDPQWQAKLAGGFVRAIDGFFANLAAVE